MRAFCPCISCAILYDLHSFFQPHGSYKIDIRLENRSVELLLKSPLIYNYNNLIPGPNLLSNMTYKLLPVLAALSLAAPTDDSPSIIVRAREAAQKRSPIPSQTVTRVVCSLTLMQSEDCSPNTKDLFGMIQLQDASGILVAQER